MLVLGVESSCDETSIAILETPNHLLASTVSSQDAIHAKYGGVVPEIASRQHMEDIVPLFKKTLASAGIALNQIDGVAATKSPGLIGSLLVGLSFAKAIAYSTGKPFIGVNHLEGHLNAVHLENNNVPYPHVGLVVSGGHTSLYLVHSFSNYKLLGATRDDAAGEAFDKTAKLLGLGYPGGPIIDKISKDGNPKTFKFTFPKISSGTAFDIEEFDFSFSGIKTAVMMLVKKVPNIKIEDVAASFQSAVVDVLCRQILKACKKYDCKTIVISGGVAANSRLRIKIQELCVEKELKVFMPSLKFCTDNAGMIAYVGGKYLEAGKRDDMTISAVANEEIGRKCT